MEAFYLLSLDKEARLMSMADLYTYIHAYRGQFLQFHILSNSHLRARSHGCEQQKDNQSQFSESGANKRNDLIAMEILVV